MRIAFKPALIWEVGVDAKIFPQTTADSKPFPMKPQKFYLNLPFFTSTWSSHKKLKEKATFFIWYMQKINFFLKHYLQEMVHAQNLHQQAVWPVPFVSAYQYQLNYAVTTLKFQNAYMCGHIIAQAMVIIHQSSTFWEMIFNEQTKSSHLFLKSLLFNSKNRGKSI